MEELAIDKYHITILASLSEASSITRTAREGQEDEVLMLHRSITPCKWKFPA